MSAEILDDLERIRQLDRSGMAPLIAGLPGQLAQTPRLVEAGSWPRWTRNDFDGIVVLGMGGSAIGGDLVRAYLGDTLPVPMSIVRDYRLPRWVNLRALVVASSYSGNTEETLRAVEEASRRSCRIIALCSGGELGRLAERYGWPIVALPGGFPPRTALGYSFAAVYLTLSRFGIVDNPVALLLRLSEFLNARNAALTPNVPLADNEAKRLASAIHGRIPVVYGAAGSMAVVALRWKGQVCENAKDLAFCGEAPECNHNEIVGWGLPSVSREKMITVFLRSVDDHPRVARRFDIVGQLLHDRGVLVETVWATGDKPLLRLFSLIQLGDWVSFYLAILNGVDPTPIAAIDYLKARLNETG